MFTLDKDPKIHWVDGQFSVPFTIEYEFTTHEARKNKEGRLVNEMYLAFTGTNPTHCFQPGHNGFLWGLTDAAAGPWAGFLKNLGKGGDALGRKIAPSVVPKMG